MSTFDALFDRLDPDPRIRGKQFEHVCKWFLTNDPLYKQRLRRVWLWKEWPDRPGDIEAGIDLVAEDADGHLWAVQAKAYAEDKPIPKAELNKFLSESNTKQFSQRLLISTTTGGLHELAQRAVDAQEKPVTALDLTDLRASDGYLDWPESPDKLRPSRPPKPAAPHDYQRDAIRDVVKGFKISERGQLIMACGTGKTLTSLFIREKLGAERVLVLVPSLSLLKQTLRVWMVNRRTDFDILPVCSDVTVSRDEDAIVAHTSDLGVPVTTDPEDIARFLRRRGPRVVFGTYQSSPQVAAAFAMGGVPTIDLVLADEAHRCAGPVSSDFATVLDGSRIKARRRLFMTATPRYFTGRVLKAAQEAEYEYASMDDEATFGPVLHKLGFGAAIERRLLTDYQVSIVGVDDATYREWAERGTLVRIDESKVTDAATLAGQIGLAKAMRKYGLRRTISFHSRVKRAKEFAATLPEVVEWMPAGQRPKGKPWCAYTSGEMNAGVRGRLIQQLGAIGDGEYGLLTNARCLAEGVDVPTLDGVAFIDPRRSEVDIVQAVGRAIRKSDEKKVGTIVIPVFVDTEADPEVALDSSVFKPVWDVVRALRAHDDELGRQLDELRRELGRKGGRPRLPDKIHVDLPNAIGRDFSNAFDARLVEETSAPWEFWYGLLEQFTNEHGHARVPRGYSSDGYKLDNWVTNQRAFRRRGVLSEERQQRLEQLPGWAWDPHDEQWEQTFRSLREFVAANGHARVSRSHDQLGAWVQAQRQKFAKGTLESDRQRRLESLAGWTWDPHDYQWETGFALLVKYVRAHRNARVPRSYRVDDFNLGWWVSTQRQKFGKGSLDGDRRRRLEAIAGWSWDPFVEQWEEGFAHLADYVGVHGNARVPSGGTYEGFPLGRWVSRQRVAHSKGELSTDRTARLESLSGWAWDDIAARWEEGFNHLLAYVAERGSARVPFSYRSPDGLRLGQWINVQRNAYAAGTLTDDRRERLEQLKGWSWNTRLQLWEDGYAALRRYVDEFGDARVQYQCVYKGFKLGIWVTTQRRAYTTGKLERERQERLSQLPGWMWDVKDEQWEDGFAHLVEFGERTGTARMPVKYIDESGFALGAWTNSQRQLGNRGDLDPARVKRLEALPGWSWHMKNDAWDEKFSLLMEYASEHGNVNVPSAYVFRGVALGSWAAVQRSAAAAGRLDPARYRRLDALPGWVWDTFDARWEDGFAKLLKYVECEGTPFVPQSCQLDGFALGGWVSAQRSKNAAGELSEDRKRRLEALPGWMWDVKGEQWEAAFALLQRYAKAEGNPDVPGGCVFAGYKLGDWVERQRRAYAKGDLSTGRVRRLEAVKGWQWNPKADQWERGFSELLTFVAERGHALVPGAHKVGSYRLGGWVLTQRVAFADGTIDPERKRRLEEVPGWSWNPHTDSWERAFGLLEQYAAEHGNARPPDSYRVDNFGLGAWVGIQRGAQRKGKLTAERVRRLERLPGWVWDHRAANWEEGMEKLLQFVKSQGHCFVPQRVPFDGYPLGTWVARQRRDYARGSLDLERQRRLDEVPGWTWNPHAEKWGVPVS
ncbi:DEAD/DEAH box helicase [Mycolicibacterium celeriflavum]|uniref:Uncharacterized protein n=1 Tax=Mycolicibacterium celeriflavum TaxID=1249101 RepID=A0A1X0BPD4_MYCCF|nr:DEAD/DEAH box helicase [Mycolicibacterium celeriflavum]MCV7239795.1 Helicase associated domain protein [Mycolicibacterium celeriflavum]ORA44543.1 hypothetical protein BST21_19490 [Mycolicibacterium celeriflavum]BBY41780.1 hypothetical protein MCEL_00750 [Mycolicibacterium celeriflavum]